MFTTPCFVQVKGPEKQKELIEWLEGIGYNISNIDMPILNLSTAIVTYGSNAYDYRVFGSVHLKVNSIIHCGSNVELFKALAAMNDENDREQWFVEEGRMFKCTSDKINNYSYHWMTTRKASVAEIIEHFTGR